MTISTSYAINELGDQLLYGDIRLFFQLENSRKEQVCGTLNRWFKTSDSVLLLLIDSEKIQASSKLVYEAPDGNHDSELTFPHLYGPLNVSAVTGTQLVTRESGSEWKLEFN